MARQGFFKASTLMQSTLQQASSVPKCGACGLYKTCKSPKMKPAGSGRKSILIVAEHPGKDEDEQGRQLVGKSGKYLEQVLRKFGVDLRGDCVLTNALICHPPNNEIQDWDQIAHCRPNLLQTIKEIEPELIIPLGGVPVQSLIGHLWKEDVDGIGRWAGWQIPSQALNAWICPTWHPAYILRERDRRNVVLEKHFEYQIEQALKHKERPWDKVPNYKSQIDVVLDPTDAAAILDKMIEKGGHVSFDYETNMLKPDHPKSHLVSAAVSWRGKKTIAFPFVGAAIPAMRRLVRSPLPKSAANLKMEERWTQAKLGTKVRNWVWDSCLGGHVHDYRDYVTGLKFQAFVMLGAIPWNNHIASLLQPSGKKKGGYAINRVKEIDIKDLLLYNGMDALIEYHVGQKQQELLRYS
jgi:uracil-DNA glycosylase family 4